MKNYKSIVPIVLVVCMLLSFYMLYDGRTANIREYDAYLQEARKLASQGILIDAKVNYEKALEINNTVELNVEIGNMYKNLNENKKAINWGEETVAAFPESPLAYEFLLDLYRQNNDFKSCFALYDTIVKREATSEKINAVMDEIKYFYFFGQSYDGVGTFSNGFCPVMVNEKWGLISETGKRVVAYSFKKIGNYISELAPVISENGDAYYIDKSGNKKKVIQIDGKIKELSSVTGEIFAVNNGDTWAFYNLKCEKLSGDYEEVSLLANGAAAVKTGGQWQIINNSFSLVNDKKYTEVVQDERGIICRNDSIFVNENGKYYMINAAGDRKSEKDFLGARAFLDDTYAAVKTEKGWTYIDADGNFVFGDLFFEEARSFSNGFAAVKNDGSWGYINNEGELVIECIFADAKDFNKSGCTFVKNEEVWDLLRLYSYNH